MGDTSPPRDARKWQGSRARTKNGRARGKSRLPRVLTLLFVILALAGALVALVLYMQPAPQPLLVVIRIDQFDDPLLPFSPWGGSIPGGWNAWYAAGLSQEFKPGELVGQCDRPERQADERMDVVLQHQQAGRQHGNLQQLEVSCEQCSGGQQRKSASTEQPGGWGGFAVRRVIHAVRRPGPPGRALLPLRSGQQRRRRGSTLPGSAITGQPAAEEGSGYQWRSKPSLGCGPGFRRTREDGAMSRRRHWQVEQRGLPLAPRPRTLPPVLVVLGVLAAVAAVVLLLALSQGRAVGLLPVLGVMALRVRGRRWGPPARRYGAPAPPAPAAPPQPASGRPAPERPAWPLVKQRYGELQRSYAAFECDPLAVLRLPALVDVSVPSTARFVEALAEAQALDSDQEPPPAHRDLFAAAVDRACRAWKAARDAAERIRLSHLSPEERGAVERVVKLLTTAQDSDNDAERLTAYAKARSELTRLERAGNVRLPRPAVAALEAVTRGQLPPAPAS